MPVADVFTVASADSYHKPVVHPQLPQERGGTAPSTAPMEKAKSWLPSMFQRSKHAAKQKDVMKKLKNNLRYSAVAMSRVRP